METHIQKSDIIRLPSVSVVLPISSDSVKISLRSIAQRIHDVQYEIQNNVLSNSALLKKSLGVAQDAVKRTIQLSAELEASMASVNDPVNGFRARLDKLNEERDNAFLELKLADKTITILRLLEMVAKIGFDEYDDAVNRGDLRAAAAITLSL
ncbi:hypothetical protein HK096_008260, partial [Nowakowskiella sp. JEL0078]